MTHQADKRFAILDTYRGFVIINMIAFHFLYDVFMAFGIDRTWYFQPVNRIWQQFICWSFILLSGWVWPYGASKALKRGIFLNFCGLIITAVTAIAMPSQIVIFGVLNFLGCAVLLVIPLEKLLKKLPSMLGLIAFFALFIIFYYCNTWSIGIESILLIPIGFPTRGFFSSDYFSILPWFFFYVTGYYLGRMLENKKGFLRISDVKIPVLDIIGRKSIWIYLIHQPLCYGICLLLFRALQIEK
ncbi:MAG: DUF1624 domain-containing protein [Lachnospiraceae bacterium]|nr:DUF1624 domain-containing protein [Lachnospiraceae bacterium]